jgi:octaprenyl-diphosphate synthase
MPVVEHPGAVMTQAVPVDTPAPGPLERLAATLAPEMAGVDALIRARMASENAPRIPEVTAHLVDAGGKRVRPMLTVAAARLCGYGTGATEGGDADLKLAATVEFIHTATLLHDDVVDDSRQRRGRPTANLLWDNQSSVLVGDYLFARSFQLMVETGSLRVLDILSGAAATIAEGEVLQLTAARNVATDEATWLRVVRGKTAALFEAAAEVGGVIAGAPEDQVAALAEFGDALGVSFQIVDDWLDYGGAGDGIGKDLGDDFREGKLTLPVIRAVARADAEERTFWRDALERGRSGDLARARSILERHGTLEETRLEALAWRDRARGALARLPGGPLRDLLGELADYVVERAV